MKKTSTCFQITPKTIKDVSDRQMAFDEDGNYYFPYTEPKVIDWHQPLSVAHKDVVVTGSSLPEMRSVTLTLIGEPMPKQSVRSFATGAFTLSKTGKKIYTVQHYQPTEMITRTKDYISQIKQQLPKDFIRFESRVHVKMMHFIFTPLKSFSKKIIGSISNGEIVYKETKPDLPDNLKKLVNDSMSELVFKDDSIIVSEDNVKKYYGIVPCIKIELEGY